MNLLKLELKLHFRSLCAWGISISVIILLLMAFFPSMQTEAMQQLAGAKLEGIPDSVLAVLGLTKDALDLTNVFYFFSYVMNFINMALAVFATLIGANSLIKEENDGTIEYLYAQPISRFQIVLNKMWGGALAYALLTFWLSAVTLLAFMLFGNGVSPEDALLSIVKIFGGTFFVGIVFMSVGFLGSTLLENTKRTATFSISVVFGTFVMGIMSVVSKKLDFLLYFSPLDTVKPNILISSGMDPTGALVGIGIILFCVILCMAIYRKKDLKV